MIVSGITFWRDRSTRHGMPFANHADEAIQEERLYAHFWSGLAQDADFQVYEAFSQRPHILIGVGRKAQSNAGRRCRHGLHQPHRKCLYEAFIGVQCENPVQGGCVRPLAGWLQYSVDFMSQISNALA
jgi:hypothetical protein